MCYSGTLCLKTGLWVHICNDRKENIAKLLGKHDLAKYIRIVSMYLLLLRNKGIDPPPPKKKKKISAGTGTDVGGPNFRPNNSKEASKNVL
jgi:hypothetical protein